MLGHLVSAIFAGFVSDAIGRKKSLLLDTAVFFLGFVMLATGHLPACLIIGRLLLGYPLVSQVRSGDWALRQKYELGENYRCTSVRFSMWTDVGLELPCTPFFILLVSFLFFSQVLFALIYWSVINDKKHYRCLLAMENSSVSSWYTCHPNLCLHIVPSRVSGMAS